MKKEEYAAQSLAVLKELAKSRKMRGISTMKKGDLIEALLAFDASHAERAEDAGETAEKRLAFGTRRTRTAENTPKAEEAAENAETAEEKPEPENRKTRTAVTKTQENMQMAEHGSGKTESTVPVRSTNLKNRRVNRPVSGSTARNENRETGGANENSGERNTSGTAHREFTGGEITRSGGRFRRIEADTRRQEYGGQQEGRRERTGMNRIVRRDNTQSSNYRRENQESSGYTGHRRESQEAGYTSHSNRFSYRNNNMAAGQPGTNGESAEQAGDISYRNPNSGTDNRGNNADNHRNQNAELRQMGTGSYRSQGQRTDGENRQNGSDAYRVQRTGAEERMNHGSDTYPRTQNPGTEGRANNTDGYRSQGQRSDEAGPEQERNAGTAQTQELRGDDRPSQDLSALDSGQEACGILEVMTEGFGFIRSDNFMSGDNDVYVSPSQIRRFGLRTGDIISGNTRIKTMQEKYSALLYLKTINGMAPSEAMKRSKFEDMTPIFPNERLSMERGSSGIAMRIVDLFSPIGKGQRGMIVSPPKAGKTTLLKDVAHSILENDSNMQLIILLIDERPEEVTDIKEAIQGENVEVIYSTFDEQPEHHKRVSEMVIERAKRLVEQRKDVTILLDSITRLARAYNLTVPPSGRTLSGGLDPAALHMPKRFFGAARNMREGGSLTILATALVDTGSKMDDVVYEEFKGTGNLELVLARKLSERRVFPAIDIPKSGTRREDLLLDREEQEAVYIMRRALNGMKSEDAVENILNMFVHTKTNKELVAQVRRQRFV